MWRTVSEKGIFEMVVVLNMTEKEAVEYFYRQMEFGLIRSDEMQLAYELAISALEKQISESEE